VLLGARRGLLGAAVPLLVMCVAGYWLDMDSDAARHFEVLSALLFACLGWVFLNVARDRDANDARAPVPGAIS